MSVQKFAQYQIQIYHNTLLYQWAGPVGCIVYKYSWMCIETGYIETPVISMFTVCQRHKNNWDWLQISFRKCTF